MKVRFVVLCLTAAAMLISCKKNGDSPTQIPETPPPVSYSNVKILQVKFKGYPLTEANGAGWDNNSGPDLYFALADQAGTILVNGKPTTIPNMTTDKLPITINLTQAFAITNLKTKFKLLVYDNDNDDFPSNADDYMGGYEFSMEGFKALDYPKTILVSNSSSQLKLEFLVEWY